MRKRIFVGPPGLADSPSAPSAPSADLMVLFAAADYPCAKNRVVFERYVIAIDCKAGGPRRAPTTLEIWPVFRVLSSGADIVRSAAGLTFSSPECLPWRPTIRPRAKQPWRRANAAWAGRRWVTTASCFGATPSIRPAMGEAGNRHPLRPEDIANRSPAVQRPLHGPRSRFADPWRSRSDAAALVPRLRTGGPADHGIAIDCKNPEVGRVPPGSSSTVVTRFIYRWRRGSDGASPTSISIRRCTPLTAASSGSACTSRISRWCARCSNASDCMISPSRTRRALISGRSSTSSDSPVHRAAHGLDASEFPCSIAYRRRQSRGRRGRP